MGLALEGSAPRKLVSLFLLEFPVLGGQSQPGLARSSSARAGR